MATVTREKIGLLNEKIIVKVETDDYLPSFKKAIKNYSKQANVRGFRKGQATEGIVKKMYGSSLFADEVIKSVEKGLNEFMTNEKLQIFAQPLPLLTDDIPKLDMNQPAEYQYSFEVGLKPEFSIADLAQAHVTRYKVTVTDEAVNEELDRMQVSGGKMTEQETISSEDNSLHLAFAESDSEGNEIEGGFHKTSSLPVKYFTPEIRNEFMGKKMGDVIIIQLSRAFVEKELEWISSELELAKDDPEAINKFFRLTLQKVELLEKAALNEEFFKNMYPGLEITSEEELRNELRKDIETQWDSQSRNQLHDQIYHELLNHTTIEFPEDFLKRWMLTGTEKQKTAEEVEHEFPVFVNQLKWSLITDKIAQENNIQVLPDEIVGYAKSQLLGYMGGSDINLDQPWIKEYLGRMMKDKKFVEDAHNRILTDKIFMYTETLVHPIETPISTEDFTKMLEEHKHHH